ncbi:MAG: sulfur relay protein DsrC [Pseudomonadota bacterium]
MLALSEILMQNHSMQSFEELKLELQNRAQQGEIFFQMDVRPPFKDTPEDWEDILESVFTSARGS